MELQGKIKMIGKTETYGEKGFRKRELVITTDEQYKQTILIEFVQDKTDLLDSFKVGEDVKIGINVRGREWINPKGETKYFNSIQGWNINKTASDKLVEGAKIIDYAFEPAGDLDEDDKDDLPF